MFAAYEGVHILLCSTACSAVFQVANENFMGPNSMEETKSMSIGRPIGK